jgi:hypothetical protein
LSVDSKFGAFVTEYLGDCPKHVKSLSTVWCTQMVSTLAQLVGVRFEQLPRSRGATRDACNRAALQRVAHGSGWSLVDRVVFKGRKE